MMGTAEEIEWVENWDSHKEAYLSKTMNVFYKFKCADLFLEINRPYAIEWVDPSKYRRYKFVIWRNLTVVKYRTDLDPHCMVKQLNLANFLEDK